MLITIFGLDDVVFYSIATPVILGVIITGIYKFIQMEGTLTALKENFSKHEKSTNERFDKGELRMDGIANNHSNLVNSVHEMETRIVNAVHESQRETITTILDFLKPKQ